MLLLDAVGSECHRAFLLALFRGLGDGQVDQAPHLGALRLGALLGEVGERAELQNLDGFEVVLVERRLIGFPFLFAR